MAETSKESAVIDHADADKRIIMNLPEIMILSRRLESTSKEYVKTTEELISTRSSGLPMEEYFLRARSKLPEILKMLLEVLGEISSEPLESLQEPVQSSHEPVQSLKELLNYLVCFMEQETSLNGELLEYNRYIWPLERMMEDLEMKELEGKHKRMEQEREDRDAVEFRVMRFMADNLEMEFIRSQDNFYMLEQHEGMERESEDRDSRKLDEILEKLRILLLKFEALQCIFDKMMLIQAKLRQTSYGEQVRIIDDIKSALLEFPFKPLTKSGDADTTEQVKKGLRQKLGEMDEKLRFLRWKFERSHKFFHRIMFTQAELEARLWKQERIIDDLRSAVREPRFKLLTKLGDADTTEQVMKGLGQKVDELDEKFRIHQQKFEARRKDITAELEASSKQERIIDDLVSAVRESRFKVDVMGEKFRILQQKLETSQDIVEPMRKDITLLTKSGDADTTKQVMKGWRQKVDEMGEKFRILQQKLETSQDIVEPMRKDITLLTKSGDADTTEQVMKGWRQKVDEVHEKLRILQQRVQESQDIAETRLKDIPVDEINEKLRIVQQRVQTIHDSLEKIVIKEIADARSLAVQFMSAHTCCVRAVPYVNDIKEGQEKYFKMRLYIHASGNEIPEGVREAAEIKFKDYEIDYCDLQRRPLNRIVTQLPSSEKKREKELSELSKIIEENLHLFEKRLNVTAVQASYKVTDAKEKDELCVTVFVLEKGQIPAGETIFKGEMFGGYSSDIAEGYYLPAGSSSLESYVKPLHSGVGIGVKDEPGAGTLGGFLTDEEGKCYILSCEHVLHPGKKMDNPAIVQPAESDYEEIAAKARKELKPYSTITQKDLKEMGDDDFSERLSRFIQQKRDLIEKDKPRPIATYTCGVKKNIEVTFESRAVKVFVDAAIAELENSERDFMTKFSQDNPLYGCTSQYFENSPKGEIVKMADFETERKKEMSFMKVGRTTGLQDSGKIDKSSISAYINIIEAVDSPFCHFRCKHCENCGQTDSSEEEICKEDNDRLISCASCDKTFKSSDEVTSFWMRNCLAIRQRKEPFCDKGDSGALVFDSNGRAWGLVVGVFWDLSRDFLFCQVSPLSVTLKALESKSGKKLKFWCRE